MKISKDKIQRAFRNCGKLKLCSRTKISRDTFWQILNWMLVPILGSLSYFFVSEAWINHRFGRTNLSFDEVPVNGHPTMVICMNHPTSRYHFPLDWLEPIELYYYKVPQDNLVSNSLSSIKLKFGDNYLDDENIVLSQIGFCYSITPKPLENYHHINQEKRYVNIAFPNMYTILPASVTKILRPESYEIYDAIYFSLFSEMPLHVFFTHEDNALPVAMGLHMQEGEAFDTKMIRQTYGDVMLSIDLKTKKIKYIKEKTTCTDEQITLESLGPDLAREVEKICQCYPKEFPLELAKPGIPFCQDFYMGTYCFKDVWRKFFRENSKLRQCTKFEYEGIFRLRTLAKSIVADESILQEGSVIENKTKFIIEYKFQQPETVLLTEEYYIVPTLDLIGLIGGTLGMFVGFSVYGTFADALSLVLSIAKKMTNPGKTYKGLPEKPC